MQQSGRLTYVVVMMQDEIGQLKVVLDGRMDNLDVERRPDGTGTIYGKFAREVPREAIEKLVEAQRKKAEEAAEEAPSNGKEAKEEEALASPEPPEGGKKKRGRPRKKAPAEA